ncbi:MAG: LPS export ABC transporter permease LptF [Rhodospirillales bacterium]
MNAFTRYVLRQLLVGMVVVTASLTCVIWLLQSLRFVEMIVNRGLTAGGFVYLTILLLPKFLTVILPIALFTVIVFTYAKLVTDRELVVMRAAGVSQHALAKPALILAFVVVAAGYALNLYIMPLASRTFHELRWDMRYNYSNVLLKEGAFNTLSAGVTVYVRARTTDGELLGILVQDDRDTEKPVTLMAERGAISRTEDGSRVMMFRGNRQEVDKETNQLSILYFDRYIFDFGATGNEGIIRYRNARERTLDELFNLDRDKNLNRKDFGKFTVEGHRRLVSPLRALAFALVGLACLISGAFGGRPLTRRVIVAVGIVVGLQAATLGLENMVARNLQLIPLMYVNAIFPVLAGYLVIVRSPRRRASPAAAGAT